MKERNRGRDRDNGSEGVPGDLPDDCIYATVYNMDGEEVRLPVLYKSAAYKPESCVSLSL
jgi:hypothetical protein